MAVAAEVIRELVGDLFSFPTDVLCVLGWCSVCLCGKILTTNVKVLDGGALCYLAVWLDAPLFPMCRVVVMCIFGAIRSGWPSRWGSRVSGNSRERERPERTCKRWWNRGGKQTKKKTSVRKNNNLRPNDCVERDSFHTLADQQPPRHLYIPEPETNPESLTQTKLVQQPRQKNKTKTTRPRCSPILMIIVIILQSTCRLYGSGRKISCLIRRTN